MMHISGLDLLVIEKKKFSVRVVYVQNELFIYDYKIKRLEITSYKKNRIKFEIWVKKAILNIWNQ